MLRNRNIAFFIDVDNVGIKNENYDNIMEQLNAMGTVLYGKFYGAGERKHKKIFADAQLRGYRVERPMRVKRRGRKEFDSRIFVDVVDAVSRTPAIDTVCIVAQPCDLVYLYSYLRAHGIKVVALDNADDASCQFIDEVVDLGVVLELKPPKKSAPRKPETERVPLPEQDTAVSDSDATASVVTASDEGLDRTDELLKEIERLKGEKATVEEEHTAPVEEPVAEEPTEQEQEELPADKTVEESSEPVDVAEQPEEERSANIVDEANALLDKIAEIRGEQEEPASAQGQQEPVQQEQPPVAEQPATRTPISSGNDSDLLRQIEELRRNNQDDDEDFIEQVRKLLEGLD